MEISDSLNKKFIDVSIKLTKAEKSDVFLRQRDPQVLINIAKYLMSQGETKISLAKLKKTYSRDKELKGMLYVLIQNIEEKLTGYIVQYIAFDKPDYHLQSKKLHSTSGQGRRKMSHFKNVNQFVLDLKIAHNNIIRHSATFPPDGYIPFNEVVSSMSLGRKAKIIKYSKPTIKTKVLSGFNMQQTPQEENFAINYFIQLNKLRNRVMHHNSVIDFKWKSEYGTFALKEFLEISTYFTTGTSTRTLVKEAYPNIKMGNRKLIKKLVK